jgi:S1-C subfamily serine protease
MFHCARTVLPALLAACLWVGGAWADNLPQTIGKIKPSIVGVGTYQQTRRPPAAFRGTGFVVADGRHVVTNAHVLPALLDTEKKEVLGVFVGQGETAQFRPARTVARDDERDLALLEIGGEALPAVSIGDSSAVREGQQVSFTGFPIGTVLGLYPVTHRATVSAITPIVIPARASSQLDIKMIKRIRAPLNVFQLDGTAYPGNSGSPLFDPETGAVLGIINMVFVKGTKENVLSEPSGISYAIPGNHIGELLKRAGL